VFTNAFPPEKAASATKQVYDTALLFTHINPSKRKTALPSERFSQRGVRSVLVTSADKHCIETSAHRRGGSAAPLCCAGVGINNLDRHRFKGIPCV
jgi:hypothetical protein